MALFLNSRKKKTTHPDPERYMKEGRTAPFVEDRESAIPDSPTVPLVSRPVPPKAPVALPQPVAVINEQPIAMQPRASALPVPEAPPEPLNIPPAPTTQPKTPSRLKGFLAGFLQAAGQGANNAMAHGNVGWGGVAQAIGGGLGGGAAMAYDPTILLKQREQKALANAQAEEERGLEVEGRRAGVEKTKAEVVELQGRPAREAAKDAHQAAQDAHQAAKDKNDAEYKAGTIRHREWQQKNADIERKFRADQKELDRKNAIVVAQQRANDAGSKDSAKQEQEAEESNYKADVAASQAREAQAELDALVEEDKKNPSFKYAQDTDPNSANYGKPRVGPDGNVIYTQDHTDDFKERESRKIALAKRVKDLYDKEGELRGKSTRGSVTAAPAAGTFSIQKAIAGGLSEADARAKAARAKAAGWTVVE